MLNANDHRDLLTLLKNGQPKSFEIIYDRFAEKLYQYVSRRVKSKEASEEIVQEIFVSLWNKRETLHITVSLDAYLFGAAKFRILSYIRSARVQREYAANFALFAAGHFDNSIVEMMDLKDLHYTIEKSISHLPEKCRTAFRLSRIDHEPIPQIAGRMNISERTVENYLSQALKHLRISLGQYLSILILWAFNILA
jgi:RNA polymerase sigma-70 factor (family 1)